MEIEIRAQLNETQSKEIKDLIVLKGGQKIESISQSDLYLKHQSDHERKLVFRIRKTPESSELTLKSKSTGKDTAWPNIDLPLSDPDLLENMLMSNGYEKVVYIQKERDTYHLDDFEVNIDRIDNLGTFIEIEGRGSETERNQIELSIKKLMKKLSISSEQIINQGYVPLMINKS